MTNTGDELAPWNDPDALLAALVRIPRAELPHVRDKIRALLDHDDPDVREHAIRRLFVHLKYRGGGNELLGMLDDSAIGVRRAAAFGIAATTTDATRLGDLGNLLRVLCDENEHPVVREAAYEAVLLMEGRRDFPTLTREFDAGRDVDWSWIDVLRQETGE